MNAAYADIKSKLHTKEDRLFLENNPFTGVLKKEDNGERKERSYTNGVLHGIQKEFYKNGNLQKVSMYTNGELNGRMIEYYPCGAKRLNANYSEGSIEGILEEWSNDGILILRKTYFKGKLIAIKSN